MKGMTRIFIENKQIEEMLDMEPVDVFESMDDVLDDEYEANNESTESDWFGGHDPLFDL